MKDSGMDPQNIDQIAQALRKMNEVLGQQNQIISQNKKSMDLMSASMAKTNEEYGKELSYTDKLGRALPTLRKKLDKVKDSYAKTEDKIKSVNEELAGDNTLAKHKKLMDSLDKLEKKKRSLKRASKKTSDVGDALEAVRSIGTMDPKDKPKILSTAKSYKEIFEALNTASQDAVDEMTKAGKFKADKGPQKKAIAEIEEVKGALASSGGFGKEFDAVLEKKPTGPVPVGFKSKRGQQVKEFGGAAKGAMGAALSGKSGFGGTFEAMKIFGDKTKSLKGAFSMAGAGTKGMKGTLKSLGAAFHVFAGGLAALSKGNIIMLIVTAFVQMAKAINNLDKFLKEQNQSFVKFAGALTVFDDITKSMKEFTDAMFDLNRNMKFGIDSKDVKEIFGGMSGGGLALSGVKSKIGDYGAAIETSTILSRSFGVSLSDMGGMVADQMLNLKSSLSDVGDTFKSLSYDASIAGVSSQKFYSATESASSSVRFYGNYLKYASGMLREFVDTGNLGFKDASEQVASFTQTFSKMSLTKRLGAIQLIGEDFVRENLTKLSKQQQEKADAVTKRIQDIDIKIAENAKISSRTSVNDDALKILEDKRKALENERGDALRESRDNAAAAKGSVQGLTLAIPRLADKTIAMIHNAVSGVGFDMFDTDQVMALQSTMATVFDMDPKTFEKHMRMIRTGLQLTNEVSEKAGDTLNSLLSKGDSELNAELGSLQDILKDTKGDMDDLEKQTGKWLNSWIKKQKEAGKETKDAEKDVLNFMQLWRQNKEVAFKMMKEGTVNISEEAKKEGVLKGLEEPGAGGEGKDQKAVAIDVTKQTVSLEKYLKIGKEGLKYSVSDSEVMRTMAAAGVDTARNTGGILSGIQTLINRFGGNIIGDFKSQEGAQSLRELTKEKKLYELRGDKVPERVSKDIAYLKKRYKKASSAMGEYEDKGEVDAINMHNLAIKLEALRARKMDPKKEPLSDEESKFYDEQSKKLKREEKTLRWGSERVKDVKTTGFKNTLMFKDFDRAGQKLLKNLADFFIPIGRGSSEKKASHEKVNPEMTGDAIITKSGVLSNYYVRAGERIVPPESAAIAKRKSYGGAMSEPGVLGGSGGPGLTTTTTVGDIHVHVDGEGKNVESLFKDDGPVEQLVLRVFRDKGIKV